MTVTGRTSPHPVTGPVGQAYDRDMTTTSHLAPVWTKSTNLQISHGKGSWVYTTDGEEYLDFSSGIAVTSTGHAHPHVVEAIQRQVARIMHAQVNCYTHDLLEPLASRLNDLTPAGIDTFFYSNSGAEITEASVKLAKHATRRPNVVVVSGSFHGRTHMAMAMTTSKTVYRLNYSSLPSGVFVTPFPDPMAADQEAEIDRCIFGFKHLLKTMTAPEETACVIMEPVLGEGGYIPAPGRYLTAIAEICKEHGILFVADEVQTGFGRTGKMFAVEHHDLEPDIICMAKGIASGFPFSALGASRELMERWTPGSHGGTYGGNAVGCAAALATIEVLTAEGFMDNVVARGEQLRAGLTEMMADDPGLVQVRGLGLMNAIQLDSAERVSAVLKHCLEDSHLIMLSTGTYGVTIRLMPSLVLTAGEADTALHAIASALKATR